MSKKVTTNGLKECILEACYEAMQSGIYTVDVGIDKNRMYYRVRDKSGHRVPRRLVLQLCDLLEAEQKILFVKTEVLLYDEDVDCFGYRLSDDEFDLHVRMHVLKELEES